MSGSKVSPNSSHTTQIRLVLSTRFRKRFSKLKTSDPKTFEIVASALRSFRSDPRRKSLRFKPVKGSPGHYSIRATRSYRIILMKTADDSGELFKAESFGTHNETYGS